jgi:hypothetical protein
MSASRLHMGSRMLRTSLLASLLFTSLLSACADDDEIWMPPSGTGKADAVQIIKGSDIPSQYVSNNKHYLTMRRMQPLEQIEALKDVMGSVAHRADGIIANLPANGYIDAAELVRMESSQIFPTLFPEEQQALPKLWSLLEAPDPNAQTVGVPAPDLTVTEQVTQPSGLTYPTSLAISTLPSDQQTVAKRVQLVFNGDNNAQTIQIADIDKVLADPQAFTPSEVTQLQAIKLLFIERATSSEEAKAKVPKPGHTAKTTTFGQMSLELTSDVVLHEQRTLYNGNTNWNVNLTLEQTLNATLHAPANSKVLLLQVDGSGDTVYDAPDVVFGPDQSGTVVVERFEMGVRKEAHALKLPDFKPGMLTTDLAGVIDFTLETGGTKLEKNAYNLSQSGSWQYLDSRYETTLNPNPAIAQSTIDQFKTVKSPLATGRYEIQTQYGLLALDLYPEGVVIAHMNAATARLRPTGSGYEQIAQSNSVGGYAVVFFPARNQITVANQTLTITTAQRTK